MLRDSESWHEMKYHDLMPCPRCGMGIMERREVGERTVEYCCNRCSFLHLEERGVRIIKPNFGK